jgi:hypothetical protein
METRGGSLGRKGGAGDQGSRPAAGWLGKCRRPQYIRARAVAATESVEAERQRRLREGWSEGCAKEEK